MPTVQFDKKVFLNAIGKKLPDTLLAEKLAMLGTDLQSIDEESISVEVFPDRPDMLSLSGLARAVRSFTGVERGMKKYRVLKGKNAVIVDDNLKSIRPFTACAIVRGMKLDDEKIKQIIDLQEKLHVTYGRKRKRMAMGVYPLDAITFPVRFEGQEPSDINFIPLDMSKSLNAHQILGEHPKGQEYGWLLNNCKYFPIFIDNKDNILSLVPIVNSEQTGKITTSTKDAFIEVSGHDFNVCHTALIIIATALADMGAKLETVEVRYGKKKVITPDFTPSTMSLNAKAVNELLGTDLKQAQVCTALKKMGYDATGTTVKIPSYRSDILHEVDLIEDVAIGYGYDLLKGTKPHNDTVGQETVTAKQERLLRQLFANLGYIEVKNWCLSDRETQVSKVAQMRRPLEMENALSSEQNVLRTSLLPGLLETLSKNRQNEYPQFLFEIGSSWTPEEEIRLAFVACGERTGFTEAKSVLETVLRQLGKELQVKPYEDKFFISGRAAVLPGGFFGEVHPQILENFDIAFGVVAGEVRIKELFE